MNSSFLEDCLDRLITVPQDVRRCMELIKTLDTRWKNVMARLRAAQHEYVERVKKAVKDMPRDGSRDLRAETEDKPALDEIAALRREAQQLSDEKVAAANQAHEALDYHISKLETELAVYRDSMQEPVSSSNRMDGDFVDPSTLADIGGDDDMSVDGYESKSRYRPSGGGYAIPKAAAPSRMSAAPAAAPASFAGQQHSGRPSGYGAAPAGSAIPRGGGAASNAMAALARQSSMDAGAGGMVPSYVAARSAGGGITMATSLMTPTAAAVDVPMEGGPDDAKYCICNRPAFGDMIGCDNDDCEKEWFHLQCVGLNEAPDGKWICPPCRTKAAAAPPPARPKPRKH